MIWAGILFCCYKLLKVSKFYKLELREFLPPVNYLTSNNIISNKFKFNLLLSSKLALMHTRVFYDRKTSFLDFALHRWEDWLRKHKNMESFSFVWASKDVFHDGKLNSFHIIFKHFLKESFNLSWEIFQQVIRYQIQNLDHPLFFVLWYLFTPNIFWRIDIL